MTSSEIIKLLPYQKPFLFVDEIKSISEEGIIGRYKIKEDEYFFEGHFPDLPITPGVIITEIMAQIGLVSLGIYLKKKGEKTPELFPFFSSSVVEFLAPARPGDLLEVVSTKVYFRFNKLKCQVECKNLTTREVISRGELSGVMVEKSK